MGSEALWAKPIGEGEDTYVMHTSWPLNMSASQVGKRIAEAMQGRDDWTVAGVW